MRIAILSAFYPFRGGIAQYSASLYRALSEKHEVCAFTFTQQYPRFLFPGETQLVQEGDRADVIPSVAMVDSINPFTWSMAAKEICGFEPDVLIINHWMSFFGPCFGSIAKRVGKQCKVITIVHNAIPHEPRFFDKPFTRYLIKHSDQFLVMSEAVQRDLQTFGIGSEEIVHIPHPYYDHFGTLVTREKAQEKLALDPSRRTLLFFGFIRAYKGLDLLLESLELIDGPYQLLIAGESYGSFERYEELIDKSRYNAHIHVHKRYIADDEVPVFFGAADVCMLPYHSATQSGIANIASHFNLPMIATDVGGLRESIEHGQTGLVVPPDARSLALAITRYFQEKEQATFSRSISANKEENSWSKFADKLLSFTSKSKH